MPDITQVLLQLYDLLKKNNKMALVTKMSFKDAKKLLVASKSVLAHYHPSSCYLWLAVGHICHFVVEKLVDFVFFTLSDIEKQ